MPTVPIPMLSGDRRVRTQPGRRSRLDRGDDSAHEGLESAIFSRAAFSSSPTVGNRRKERLVGVLRSRGKGLLLRGIPTLATLPRGLPAHQKTDLQGRRATAVWLLLGSYATHGTPNNAGTEALSPAGTHATHNKTSAHAIKNKEKKK